MTTTAERVSTWIEAYATAWRRGDAEAAAALFTEDCLFRSHPFREPEDARVYARRVLAEETDQRVWFGAPVATDGGRAAIEYWATMLEDGTEVTLAGCCVVRVGADGRCSSLRDYWATQPGRTPPTEGWGT